MTNKPIIRCSSLPQLLACPGSRVLVDLIRPEGEDDTASQEGVWAHRHVAQRLIDEEEAVGVAMGQASSDYKPSPFARWMADFAFDAVTVDLGLEWAIAVEQEMQWEFPNFILTGHPDFVAVNSAGAAKVWDFKFGSIPVEIADYNEQLVGYFALLALTHPVGAVEISASIVQPRNNDEGDFPRISSITITGAETIKKVVETLEQRINTALGNWRELSSDGGKQCRWCTAAMQCPVIKEEINAMKKTMTDLELAAIQPETPLARLIELHDAGRLLNPVFDRGHEVLKERIHAMGDATVLPDGRHALLKPRNGKRTITDNAKASEALEALPDALYNTCYEFKPSAIEEALAKHENVPVGGKGEVTGKKLFKVKLGDITEQAVNMVLTVE